MGLVYDKAPWADRLWAQHLDHAPQARATVRDGEHRQTGFAGLATDLHSSLYSRNTPTQRDDAPAWATDLLATAQGLAEWPQLKTRCQASGFAAGLATEHLLPGLLGLLPEPGDEDDDDSDGGGEGGCGQGPGTDGAGDDQDAARRRTLRQALRQAGQAVDAAEAAMEGLAAACGLQAGTGLGKAETLHDLHGAQHVRRPHRHRGRRRHPAYLAE